jgi:hypothetical protein
MVHKGKTPYALRTIKEELIFCGMVGTGRGGCLILKATHSTQDAYMMDHVTDQNMEKPTASKTVSV